MIDFNNKQRAYATLFIIGVVAFAFWWFSDIFSAWAVNANPFLVILVTILIHPEYLFLIYVLYRQYEFRGLFAGILISISLDIISLGHSITRAGGLPSDPVLYTYTDTTFYSLINTWFPGVAGPFIVYVLLSVLLVYLALRIIRRSASFNKIFKEAI